MKKVYYIRPMTCKEFVENDFPNEYTDLLNLCPFNFGLSVIPYPCKIQIIERAEVEILPEFKKELCSICWNQPAKYHGKYIMKVKVLK